MSKACFYIGKLLKRLLKIIYGNTNYQPSICITVVDEDMNILDETTLSMDQFPESSDKAYRYMVLYDKTTKQMRTFRYKYQSDTNITDIQLYENECDFSVIQKFWQTRSNSGGDAL
ncbi:MAG: hypothetical protein RSD91_06900 [Clostridiales bacterium]